jgi:flagellar hook-associated protein 1 FlgK
MESTFAGIELGKRGLITHQAGLHVTGHNVANTETEGYSRQKITLEVFDPLYIPGLTREMTPGQVGQGVQVEKILRARDMLLEDRILKETNGLAFWRGMNDWLYQVELVHNEPTDRNIMHLLDKFWASWQDLANNPEEIGVRQAVKEYGNALTRQLNANYAALKSIRDNIEAAVQARIEEINSLAKQIAKLNGEILRSEAAGDNPNDLWDKRDLLSEKLSEYVNIHIGRSDRDEYFVYIGGKHLVQGKHYEQLELQTNPQNEGYSDVVWKEDDSPLELESGELKALLAARDVELKYQIDSLDTFTVSLMDMVNEIHRKGFGLNLRTGMDFFKELPITINQAGDHDFNRDGVVDGTAVYRIIGNRMIENDDIAGIQGSITLNNGIRVDYTNTDTIADIITKVNNSGADTKFFLNSEGRLVARSDTAGFFITHLEDSGDFLAQYAGVLAARGQDGAFDYRTPGMTEVISGTYMVTPKVHPSSWVSLAEGVAGEV